MNYLIGVHDGHNASACLMADGRLLYCVQEERLTGRKNQAGMPRRAIEACLRFADLAAADVGCLAFGSLRTTPTAFRALDQRQKFQSESTVRGTLVRTFAWRPYYRLHADLGWRARQRDAGELGFNPARLARYDHHLSHAASAYFGLRRSVDEPHLVVTADGYGDLTSCALYIAAHGQLTRIAQTPFTDSLGTLYFLVTGAMGFVPLEHEYKLMGMAAYGSPERCRRLVEAFGELLELDEERLRFRRRTALPMIALSRRTLGLIRGQRFDDVCAALQQFTEAMLVRLVRAAVRRTGIRQVLCAGGVFMNVKANQRLAALPEVDRLAVFPSPGDETLALGACYLAHAESEPDRGSGIAPLGDFYLGDDVTEADCREALDGCGYEIRRSENVEREIAGLLAAGKIVARCKGRMEFGARALGNRSILADPADQDAVRVINRMIKQRDFWMPFAPVVRRARAHDYFDNPKDLPSPYMMLTFDTKANFRDLIAAVHNADLTARPQILEPAHNADLDRLLVEFEALTGRGVLLNTSFNLHGSPIVRGAAEALAVFRESGLEFLALGQYVVAKRARVVLRQAPLAALRAAG